MNNDLEMNSGYIEEDIITLDWKEHIRERPGMYIGNLGDGQSMDDGIYMLFKEVMDNSVDEFMAGFGNKIDVTIAGHKISIRDYGRGIPLGKVIDVVSKINTGSNFGTRSFKKTAGMNGVGIKAVNALSTEFTVVSYRNHTIKKAIFSCGQLISEYEVTQTDEPNGTLISFVADDTLFTGLHIREELIIQMIRHYVCLNQGLNISLNGHRYSSKRGLVELLDTQCDGNNLYPPIEIKGKDISIAFTHINGSEEKYLSFVNGQYTYLGGPHLSAFKESVTQTIKMFYGRTWENSDIRKGIVAVFSINLEEPIFESQKKNRLGSSTIKNGEMTLSRFFKQFVNLELDNFLHKESSIAEKLKLKIQENESLRKSTMSTTAKTPKSKNPKLKNNRKLLDCQIHYCDNRGNDEKKLATTIFITEGDSAGGSITKVRDAETQAVFCLRGKTLNTYRSTDEAFDKNEELQLLWQKLNINEGLSKLPYNKVIIATDADVDGMHIRLLLVTFFLTYYPDLIREGHLYVLQTPLFRIRKHTHNRNNSEVETYYCYSDEERDKAIAKIGNDPEITRFKGLGEISPDEFVDFINENMRITQVELSGLDNIENLLNFFMGKNTRERQQYILDNLKFDDKTN